jgi:hypothetical protein
MWRSVRQTPAWDRSEGVSRKLLLFGRWSSYSANFDDHVQRSIDLGLWSLLQLQVFVVLDNADDLHFCFVLLCFDLIEREVYGYLDVYVNRVYFSYERSSSAERGEVVPLKLMHLRHKKKVWNSTSSFEDKRR